MRRRDFIKVIGGTVTWPIGTRAQQSERMRRVGIFMPYPQSDTEVQMRVRAFKQELQKLGWIEGSKIQFDERWTTDNMDKVRTEAKSLMASNPDAVLAVGGRVTPVLTQLSRTIPIVLPGSTDLVGAGLVTSLARPGGNVTGFAMIEFSVVGKSLEILKQIAPSVVRVALIYNPDNPNTVFYKRTFEASAGPLNIDPIAVPFHGIAEIDRALESLADRQNIGVLFPPDVSITAMRNDVVALVARRRMPAIYSDTAFVKAGGLVIYTADRVDLFRRSAGYVDRILRGEKAGDLPVQQPIKYVLVINLKTAKTLGYTVPQRLLVLADEVIE